MLPCSFHARCPSNCIANASTFHATSPVNPTSMSSPLNPECPYSTRMMRLATRFFSFYLWFRPGRGQLAPDLSLDRNTWFVNQRQLLARIPTSLPPLRRRLLPCLVLSLSPRFVVFVRLGSRFSSFVGSVRSRCLWRLELRCLQVFSHG